MSRLSLYPDDSLDIGRINRPFVIRVRHKEVPVHVKKHSHAWSQLTFPNNGVMTMITESGTWIIPPQRAVWIPFGVEHEMISTGPVSVRSLFVRPDKAGTLSKTCSVVGLSPLMRELILHAATLPPLYNEDGPDGRIFQTILDQLQQLPVAPLHLPEPRDSKLSRITEALKANPGDKRGANHWAKTVGLGPRTLARRFLSETNMTFGQWRQQARLLEALRRLANGQPVTTIALDLGYENQSAFIAMFRKATGVTPGRYFS